MSRFFFFAAILLLSNSCRSFKNGKSADAGISQERILGAWTDGNSDNATFSIRTDSIFYVDHLETYKYILRNDSIHIYYPGMDYAAKLSFSGDTMIFSSASGVSKVWKFKS